MTRKLEFENGVLVKVDGMRPDYMDGNTLIRLVKELALAHRPVDGEGYELITRRVVWVLRLGWIGDSEGRTWAKEFKSEERFTTQALAQQAMEVHPEVKLVNFGSINSWRTTYGHGQVGIFRIEETTQ